MDCDAWPGIIVGPTASLYVFPRLSVTAETVAVLSFHPTTMTFRSPAVWAALNVTFTALCADCGTAALLCTCVIVDEGGGAGLIVIVRLAVLVPTLLVALSVIVAVAALAGVPEITPVAVLMERP